ncbi:MAG: hypothetical protein WA919_03485 [Coleofasciculaceae cyanobacterium]
MTKTKIRPVRDVRLRRNRQLTTPTTAILLDAPKALPVERLREQITVFYSFLQLSLGIFDSTITSNYDSSRIW